MSRTLARIQEELSRIREEKKMCSRIARATSSVSRNLPSCHVPLDVDASLFEYAEKRAHTTDRCRPRIPHVFVSVHERHKRSKSYVDVAYLQDYTDRFAALRELIRIQFKSITDIFHKLDKNGNGRLTVTELMDCLTYLHVPWQQVSGLTRMEFTNLVDSQKSGVVDILDFLGVMGLTPRLPWSALPPIEQWEEYTNKILELDLLNLEPCEPLWWSVLDDNPRPTNSYSGIAAMNIIKRSRLDVAERLMSPVANRKGELMDPSRTIFLSREDLDYIQTKVRRIEKFLRDFNDNKRELAKLKNDLQNVTEAEEKKAESNKRREEEEMEKRRLKQEAGLALVMSDSGTKRSIFGNRNRVELTQFSKPSEDELVELFDTRENLDDKEVAFRAFVRMSGLSLFVGDKLRRTFIKHAGDRVGDEATFSKIICELVVGDLPCTKIRQHWLTASVGGSVSLDLSGFITWYSKFNL